MSKQTPQDKNLGVIIRNVPYSLSDEEIQNELSSELPGTQSKSTLSIEII